MSAFTRFAGSAIALHWSTSVDWVIAQCTPCMDELKGRVWDADGRPPWHAEIHREDLEHVMVRLATAQLKHEAYRVSYRLRLGDNLVTVIESGSPLFDNNAFNGYMGTLIEVDQHLINRNHSNLHNQQLSEERFRSLTRLSTDWLWETDTEHRFTYLSEGFQRVFGIKPETLIGKTRWDITSDPDAPDLTECRRKVEQHLPFRGIRYEIRLDGSIPRQAEVAGEPVFDDDRFVGYRGIAHDVTADVAHAQTLVRMAEENQAFLDNALDIIALIDRNGFIRKINRACREITGYSEEELLSKPYQQFIAQSLNPGIGGLPFENAEDPDRQTGTTENTWIHESGRRIRISWSWRRTHDDMFYVTGRDIAARYQDRISLIRANNRLNRVLESIGDAFIAVDHDWQVTYANHKMGGFIGQDSDRILGHPFWSVFPAHLRSKLFPAFQQELKYGEHAFFELHYTDINTWIEVRAYCHDEGLSIFFHDVSERRAAEQAMRDREERLREVIEATPAGYFECNASGLLRDVNPALCQLADYEANELLGRRISLVLPESLYEQFVDPNGATLLQGFESTLIRRDGGLRYVSINANIKRDDRGRPTDMVGFVTDITSRKQNERQLERLATHDPVTGLRNRTFINLHLQTVLDTAARDECNAIMFIDLDRFKDINDELGHEAGDKLLQTIGRRLRQATRPGDIVARFGGDEFVIIAHCGRAEERAAARIAEKLCEMIAEPVEIGNETVEVGASIGISIAPRDGQSIEALFNKADYAMYRVKDSGRNGWHLFNPDTDDTGSD